MANELSRQELLRIADQFRNSKLILNHVRITGWAVRASNPMVDLMVSAIAGKNPIELRGYKYYRLAFWGDGKEQFDRLSESAIGIFDRMGLTGKKPGTPLIYPSFMDGENEPGHLMAIYIDQIAELSREALLQPTRGKPSHLSYPNSPLRDLDSIVLPRGCVGLRDVEEYFQGSPTESTPQEWFDGLKRDVGNDDFEPIVVFDQNLFAAAGAAIEWLVSQKGQTPTSMPTESVHKSKPGPKASKGEIDAAKRLVAQWKDREQPQSEKEFCIEKNITLKTLHNAKSLARKYPDEAHRLKRTDHRQ
jgi:hypothetical protein